MFVSGRNAHVQACLIELLRQQTAKL
jgi:hypothetical protein